MFPTPADPEIAAVVFGEHIDRLWATCRPLQLSWERMVLAPPDPLHAVFKLPAKRPSGEIDHYYVRLGAEYYDPAPPTVAFVQPDTWTPAVELSRWFPKIEPKPGWFGLAANHRFPNGEVKQLVCFTFTAEYYMTDHSPTDSERWRQGRHTLSATLFRLAEVLAPPYYREPMK
jgi:hypothetical protein